MAHRFDITAIIKTTIERILQLEQLPITLCTDSKSLYDCLVKLGITQEKQLIVDLMCLWQSYERREIAEIKWIDGNTNLADAMTKTKPYQALKDLINTNMVNLQVTEWVERVGVVETRTEATLKPQNKIPPVSDQWHQKGYAQGGHGLDTVWAWFHNCMGMVSDCIANGWGDARGQKLYLYNLQPQRVYEKESINWT